MWQKTCGLRKQQVRGHQIYGNCNPTSGKPKSFAGLKLSSMVEKAPVANKGINMTKTIYRGVENEANNRFVK